MGAGDPGGDRPPTSRPPLPTSQKSAGRYSVGDAVTMADVFLAPQVFNASHFGIDMARFPTIVRVNAALLELPEFRSAAPEVQPDAPEPHARS